MLLTETTVKNLKATDKHQLISDDKTTGLYLKIYANTGRKSWLYRTRKGGKWRVVTMNATTLAEARQQALKMNGDKVPDAMTFGALLDEWMTNSIEPNYVVTKNIEVYVRRGKADLGNIDLQRLRTVDLVRVLKTYAKAAPVSANRCLSSWKLALDYAIQSGYIEANPLARTTSLVVGGKEATRERVLTDKEIQQLWNWQGRNAKLLRLLLLTGLRISEGQAGYVDGDLFRMDTTKNKLPHWVFLTETAKQQLDEFDTSPTAVQAWVRRQGVTWTPHDLRRTMATRLAELQVAPHVVEKVLNHSLQGVMAVYNRHDYSEERIAAAKLWETELLKIISAA